MGEKINSLNDLLKLEDCDYKFPMLDLKITKMVFVSLFEMIAVVCFFVTTAKLAKHDTQRKYFEANLENSEGVLENNDLENSEGVNFGAAALVWNGTENELDIVSNSETRNLIFSKSNTIK